jgi:hypothetical protein
MIERGLAVQVLSVGDNDTSHFCVPGGGARYGLGGEFRALVVDLGHRI